MVGAYLVFINKANRRKPRDGTILSFVSHFVHRRPTSIAPTGKQTGDVESCQASGNL